MESVGSGISGAWRWAPCSGQEQDQGQKSREGELGTDHLSAVSTEPKDGSFLPPPQRNDLVQGGLGIKWPLRWFICLMAQLLCRGGVGELSASPDEGIGFLIGMN